MDSYVTDVQALLRDIEGNYGEEPERPRSPYPRSVYQDRPASSIFELSRHPPALRYNQQHRALEPQHPRLNVHARESFEQYPYIHQQSDNYERTMLAEPQYQFQQTSNSLTSRIAPSRISLPGHTAPYSPKSIVDEISTQRRRRENGSASTQDFRAQISHFVNTTPNQIASNPLPTRASPSSPLFNTSRRHSAQSEDSQPSSIDRHPLFTARPFNATPNTKKTRTYGPPPPSFKQRAKKRGTPEFSSSPPPYPIRAQIGLSQAPPIVQGIELISTNDLPDRFRSIFPFNPFNAIQSKCYPTAYKSDNNLVVSAPTGGGKTAIFELAICHLMSTLQNDQYKIVYMAPTKSLCSERQRDWQAKFAALDLVCAELTGDTDFAHLRSVQSASLLITTPEKWDGMTRQWKDHAKLLQLVKLFLIDEVHMLRDTRGATLEVVVSRMKSVGSNVRFIALSATIPNSEDIATWLGNNHSNQHLPAVREVFGEEFRPVKMQKHVIGLPYKGNDYGFEGVCDPKLPDIISRYGQKKPLMIFCITRKSAQSTAKILAISWANRDPGARQWRGPTQRIVVSDPDLTKTLPSAVAFHHAGLDGNDRHAVEKGFLNGQISVICCTSTLAVGVNLPCHLVIIKNTMGYQNDGLKEYADLEIMQMLGRAGRPQFDDSAVAVIITKLEKAKKYEQLIIGGELLESCLHLNLIDHLNAEIGLGTVYSVCTAKRWLAGTFLYVRLSQNPEHYKLKEDTADGTLDERIETICQRDLELLEIADLVTTGVKIKATDLGLIMARYYVQFKTMRILLGLGTQPKMSDILSSIVQAEEYHEIRLKAFEKKLFKQINSSNGIKFPIKVDLALHAHKRSLLIQSELGGVEFPVDEQYAKFKRTFQTEKNVMFHGIHRLIRCVIDIQIHLQDAVGARHALELARSFSAGVWDNSPFQMKQIEQIGPVAIRKLSMGGINSIEALEAAEPHRIELLLSKNPPFGSKMLSNLNHFPKLRVSVRMVDKDLKNGHPVSIKLKLECGFINERVPVYFNRKQIYVSLLTERSDGHLIDFRRISAKRLDGGQDVLISAEMTSHTQNITCYVMCDDIAGTMRHVEIKPGLPPHLFLATATRPQPPQQPNTDLASSGTLVNDEFGEDGIDDLDMIDAAEGRGFKDVEVFEPDEQIQKVGEDKSTLQVAWNPEQLENGKWACNHRCKDKTVCKHLCCREGLDRAPKPPRNSFVPASALVDSISLSSKQLIPQFQVNLPTTKALNGNRKDAMEEVDLTNDDELPGPSKKTPRHIQGLQKLHSNIIKCPATPVVVQKKPSYDFSTGGQLQLSFLKSVDGVDSAAEQSADYSDDFMDDLPSTLELLGRPADATKGKDTADGSDERLVASGGRAELTVAYDTNTLKDFDASLSDDDQIDAEVAPGDLNDSLTMQKDSRTEKDETSIAVTSFSTTSNVDISKTLADLPKVSASISKEDNSNRTLSTVVGKRSWERTPEAERFYDVSETKRQKHDKDANSVMPTAHTDKIEQAKPNPVIKPGQPSWVYDFDPAFIAEYQDIVDFV